jgi:hypothetical protein
VCVIGGGAAGMSMAFMLKDRGYDVVVLEKQPIVGGHCDTIHFEPPPGETVDWVDIGVRLLMDTVVLTHMGFGNWSIDLAALVRRFAGADAVMPVFHDAQQVFVDMSAGQIVIPPINETALGIALATWLGIQAAYPWTNTNIFFDRVPPETLVPFEQFALQHDLTPLAPIINVYGYFSAYATGNYSNVNAFTMLAAMSPATLTLFTAPWAYFTVKGGCMRIYNGITQYLGPGNVITNATITSVKRYHNRPARVRFRVGEERRTILCDDVIIAFPPLLDDIEFLRPDAIERHLFKDVRQHYFFTGTVDVAGPLDQQRFVIQNTDLSSIFIVPFDASPTSIARVYIPYGPAQTQVVSPYPISTVEARAIAQQAFDRVPVSLLTSANVSIFFKHGAYGPVFTTQSLRAPISPFARLEALQGHRHTYWTSALNTILAGTTHIWNNNMRLVQKFF